MRRVEPAWAEEADGHAHAGADDGGECHAVCSGGVAAFACCGAVLRWVVEVEDEVCVVGYEVDAPGGGGGEEE